MTEPRTNPTEPTLHRSAIDRLIELGEATGQDVASQVIALFLDQSPARLDKLREALDADDKKTFQMLAHSLKGSSAAVGGSRLAGICSTLEILAEGDRLPDGTAEILAEAAAELERLADEIRATFPNL